MSIEVHRFLNCDGCSKSDHGADCRRSTKEIRAARKALGWRYLIGKDYCPGCAPKYFKRLQKPAKTKRGGGK